MKQKILLKTMLLLCALIVGSVSAWATEVVTTSFTEITGTVGNDQNVTYAAYKGGGTSNPAVNSNAIRLYQNSGGATGGYIVIGVPENYIITSATIQSTMATTTGYKLVEDYPDTTPAKNTFNVSNYSLSANTDYTVSNISTRYIVFACFGTSTSSRLYLSKISITYQSADDTPAGPSINANNVEIAYNATGGSIGYTLVNGNGNVTANTTSDWLTLGTITEDEVPFTCSANTEYSTRTAVITLAYGDVMKEVTVTQAAAPKPSITASDVNIAYGATSGSIAYGLENGSGNVSAEVTNGDWLTLGTITASEVPFTCSANPETTARTATVTLSLTGATDKVVTVTQAAAPLSNIAALTSKSAGSYTVSLTDALVTYVHGTNAYLEDASGAVLLYGCAGDLETGDKITGIADVNYTVYKNLPEVTAITLAEGYTKTMGNTVTPEEVTIATLENDYTSYISRYVKIVGATVTSAFSSKNSTIEQDGSSIVLRDQNSTATLTTTVYDIVTVTAHPSIYSSTHQIAVYEQSQIVVTKVDPTITFNDGSVRVGKTLDLSTLFTSNSPGDVTYSIIEGVGDATIQGSMLTAGQEEGSVTVKAEQAESTYYNAGEATATITVKPALVLSSIAVTTAPTKTTYNEGETFDPTGMVVTATYTDNSTEAVKGYTYSPDGELTINDTEITISYTENDITKTTTQAITVNEVVDYAALPFEWDGTGTRTGITNSGVGTYSSSPYLKFDTTGDYIILKINETPGILTFDIKGNSLKGSYKFTVWESANGTDYTILKEYTSINSTTTSEELKPASTTRYIKWEYTTKDNGNVALGNIVLAEPDFTPSITISPATVDDAPFAGADGTLTVTYENIPDPISFDLQFCDANGDELQGDAPDWIDAEINEPTGEEGYSVSYIIGANNGEARTAYFKVYTFVGQDLEEVYSNLVTITQAAAPEPSITVDPATVTEDAEEHDGTLDLSYENLTISDMTDFGIQYYDAEGEEAEVPDWIEVLVAEQDPEVGEGYVVSYVVEANDGEARTAYFKVWALNGTTPVYSDLVTITQAAYVAPAVPGNWIETPLADINANDVFVIVGNNGDTYAMSNDNGTSNAPAAVPVTVAGNTLSGMIADNIKWNISVNASDEYTFYPNGTTETWLYCTNTNNGVRVGTNNNKTFIISDDGYLCNVGTSRYIGIYNSQDWRCYTGTTGNIADQTFAFYKKLAAKLNGNGYATFSATVPVDFSKATDFTAWAITEITGTSINFSQITGAVPAGTGVLLKGTANEFVYPATATSGTFTGTNLLEAVTAAKVIQANEYYGLSGNTFKKVGAGTVPAGKALLPVLAVTGSNTGSSRLTFVFEDATGIATIEHSPLTIDRYYDMQGRRVDNPKKGMYIVNGKKVVMK